MYMSYIAGNNKFLPLYLAWKSFKWMMDKGKRSSTSFLITVAESIFAPKAKAKITQTTKIFIVIDVVVSLTSPTRLSRLY